VPNVANVKGLDKLLLAVADKLEGDVDGLNKELLIQSAYRIQRLEEVAWAVGEMIVSVPRKSKDKSMRSMVMREDLKEVATRLRTAGYEVKAFV
jgi:hypothetical protein